MSINISIDVASFVISRNDVFGKGYEGLSGVYVLKDAKDVSLYVGKTVNLKSRMMGHRRESDFFREVYDIQFYPVANEFEKDILETYLINELKPIHNKAKTYYLQEDYELMLSDINEEIDEISSELKFSEMCFEASKDVPFSLAFNVIDESQMDCGYPLESDG